MRKFFFILMMLCASLVGLCQNLIQGSVQQGATPNSVNINFLPNYNSAAGEYVNYLSFSIAIPTTSAAGITPSLTMSGPFTGMSMVPAIPFTYTAGTETIWSWLYSSGPTTMAWSQNTAFTGATITFNGGSGAAPVKLIDFTNFVPSGGANSNTLFIVVTNKPPFDATNYTSMFYAIAGGSSTGTYANGDQFVQTNQSINLGICNPNANAGTVSGTSPLCIGATTTYTSNGDAGGIWSSTNTAVATVNATTGAVTATGAGTTNITYIVNGCSPNSSFKTLTISGNVSSGTVSGSSPLCIGNTANYISNGDEGGTWSSSNTAVATIDAISGIVTAVGAGTTNITYTVNSGCGSPISALKSLTVNPNVNVGTVSGTSPLTVGGTATFTSNGTAGGTWSSSNTGAATVNASTGLVTAVASGTTNISYTINSGCGSPVSALLSLTVNAPTNAGTVSGTSPICIGATTTYSSNGDAGGSWNSSNTAVATVIAGTGAVTAIGTGTTDITYTVNGVSAFKTLTVNANVSAGTVSGISQLCIGATTSYTSNGTSGGSWSSTNTAAATVNATTGAVTAVGAGTTNITYTVNSGCASPVSVFKNLTVNPNVSAGNVSGTSPLTVGGNATYTSNGTAGGSWSSSNTAVATVNATTGAVTAVGAGTTNITYTFNSGCGSPVSALAALTVNAAEVHIIQGSVQQGATPNSVNFQFLPNYTNAADEYVNYLGIAISIPTASATGITPTLNMTGPFTSMTLVPAIPFTYTDGSETTWSWVYSSGPSTMSWTKDVPFTGATVSFTGGSGVSKVRMVDFSNHSPSGGANSNTLFLVVTNKSPFDVTNSTALFYPIAGGNGSITGAYGNGDQYVETSANISLGTCNANPNAGTVSGTSPLCIGASTSYSSNGDAGGTWSSTNTSVATVNATIGAVTAVGAGTTNITYTVTGCNPISSSKILTVSANVNAGTVSGTSPICTGSTTSFTSNGDASGTWSSNNTGVATVDRTSGLVTAVSAGNATITYTINSGCGSLVSASKVITVNASVNAGTVNGTSPLTVGGSTTYNSNGTRGGTWSTTNTTVATVNPTTGQVLATGAGNTNIIYTVNSGCGSPVNASAALVVNAAELHYITGSVQQGASPNSVNVTFLPNFTSAADEYVNYLSISIAIPTASATGVTPTLSMTGPFTGMTMVPGIPFSYTAGSETIWSWVYSTGPNTMSWTKDVAFTGATISFTGGTGSSKVRMVDFTNFSPTGGANSNTYFLVVTNKAPFDVTNTANLFYAIGGVNGSVTGAYPNTDQYVETIASIFMSACNGNPNAGTVSGTSRICIGATTTYSSNGDAGGTWSSTNTAVATVNSTTGVVSAVGAGTTNITYTVSGCTPVSAFKTLTVSSNVSAGTVNGTSPLTVGGSTTYTSNGTAGGTWTSTNTAVATVNAATGQVLAVGAGNTNIIYTVNTGCGSPVTAFKTLTVNACTGGGNAGIVSGLSPLCTESVVKYTTTGTAGGTWTSSNTAVAKVNAKNGQVVTVGVGTTNITYTVDGCAGPVNAFKTLTVTGPPAITARNIIVNLTSSNCLQTVSFGSNVTVTDGINIVYKVGNKLVTSPAAFPTGQTTVIVSAGNNCGTSSSSFIVNVKDLIDPMVTCPGNITTTSTTSCTRSVNTPNPIFSDNCKVERVAWKMTGATTGSSSINGMNFVGTRTFNSGVTKITYTVWDASENAQSCSFTVTVTQSGKCTVTNSLEEIITINRINVSAFPNPSSHFFDLRINSTNKKEEVYIKIMDITGRQLQQFKGQADKLYRFGDGLAAGTYIVEVRQGIQRTTAKVIKTN
jgi:uncharacterized protein YjdB